MEDTDADGKAEDGVPYMAAPCAGLVDQRSIVNHPTISAPIPDKYINKPEHDEHELDGAVAQHGQRPAAESHRRSVITVFYDKTFCVSFKRISEGGTCTFLGK